jgi:hypothetical protein
MQGGPVKDRIWRIAMTIVPLAITALALVAARRW